MNLAVMHRLIAEGWHGLLVALGLEFFCSFELTGQVAKNRVLRCYYLVVFLVAHVKAAVSIKLSWAV